MEGAELPTYDSRAISQGQYLNKETERKLQKIQDSKVHSQPKIVAYQWELKDEPPLSDKANTANKKANASYNKLAPQRAVRLRIIELHPLKVLSDE